MGGRDEVTAGWVAVDESSASHRDKDETLVTWPGDQDHRHRHTQREEDGHQDQGDDPLLPDIVDAAHDD